MQGMVAEKRSRGKPSHRWEKDIRAIFDSKWNGRGQAPTLQGRVYSDVLKRMLSEDDAEPVCD